MDEKRMQKQLRKTFKYVVLTGIILVVAGFFFVWFLQDTVNQAADKQMKDETDEYVKRMNKQIDGDLQLLNTLAVFFENTDIMENGKISMILENAKQQNDFLSIAYFTVSGEGVIATVDGVREKNLEESQSEIQEVFASALEGKSAMSDIFWSNMTEENVFVYGIPVEKDGEIAGVLCASDHVEIFTDILDGQRVMGGTGHIHMLSRDGAFLIRSGQPIVRETKKTIFDSPYLSSDQYDEVRKQMQEEKEIRFPFQYEGNTYRTFLEPVGINGWYLFCVNSVEESNAILNLMVKVTAGLFAGIIMLVAFWLFYSQRAVRQNTDALRRLAFYDSLTGAYNFLRFRRLAEDMSREDCECAIASLNIHQFKFINEIFGKEQADSLLKHLADTIRGNLKEGEIFCRESADFFYIFLRDTERNIVRARLEQIMNAGAEVSEKSGSYHALMYCGAVISSKHGSVYELDQMMTHVMFALAKARETHQNNVWFFDSKLHEKEMMDNYVEGHMYQALKDEEFSLFLQPKADLKTGEICSAEALVRWFRKDGSMIYPDQFIPLFEENGFCKKLDMYMVDKVCSCIRDWTDRGISPISVSVNQSKAVLYEPDYTERLYEIVTRWGIRPELITLEILEGAALENPDELNRKIGLLKEKGFKISMDDFGSGYSSLNTLGRIRIDELKLDREFLREVSADESGKSCIIMEQIVEMAKKLHIRTVVEGVETKGNDQMIRGLGCDCGQGYYYGRPTAAEEFTEKFMKTPLNESQAIQKTTY